jgi:hypothetical protein
MNMICNKYMYYKMFNSIWICSPSLHTIEKKIDLKYGGMIPEFSLEILNEIIGTQKALQAEKEPEEEDYECLLILDDVVAKMAKNMQELVALAYNRRHLNITLMIITQKYNKCPKELRDVASHLILYKTANDDEEEVRKEWSYKKKDPFGELCEFVYNMPKQFLFIRRDYPEDQKYYKNFTYGPIDDDDLKKITKEPK